MDPDLAFRECPETLRLGEKTPDLPERRLSPEERRLAEHVLRRCGGGPEQMVEGARAAIAQGRSYDHLVVVCGSDQERGYWSDRLAGAERRLLKSGASLVS